jgi:hypothetical protein
VATPTLASQPIPDDLFTVADLVELLRPTPYPATRSTIERWIASNGIQAYRLGRGAQRYSYTAVMMAQRDAAARQRRRT